jgi:patatin-like phospholipase/acyl hydrolase
MGRYRLLTLDGGGIRGVLTSVLLDRLEAAHPFLRNVDMFAGTSTGGIIALGLAAGYSPSEIGALYRLQGREVFADSWVDDLLDLGKLAGAEYSLDYLHRILTERFGEMTLADLPKKVLIPAFDLDNQHPDPARRIWKPKFFHNFPGPDSDAAERVVDVALRTSAAPVYFPVYQGYIDGGVVANNPSMCTLAQAIHPHTGRQALEDVVLFSIGTGRNPQYLPVVNEDWGLAQWARHLVSLSMDGSAGTADYQVRQILGARYRRLNPLLPAPIGLDDVEKIEELIQIGSEVNLRDDLNWLDVFYT